MERDKYFSGLLYSICKGLNSFFSSKTQKKIVSDDMPENMSVVSFSIINSLDIQTRFWVDGEWNRPSVYFYSKIFLSLQQVHGEVHVSVHMCTNDYLRCIKCEVHGRVRRNVIRCTKKRVPRFLILEALLVSTSLVRILNSQGMKNYKSTESLCRSILAIYTNDWSTCRYVYCCCVYFFSGKFLNVCKPRTTTYPL